MSRDLTLKLENSRISSAPQNISLLEAGAFGIYKQLRNDIVIGKLKPNERLRFDALRATYSAGIGTLREALSHLVSDGLVRSEVGRGFRVASISAADLADVTEWRVEFETKAAVSSVRNGDHNWEAEVVSSFHLFSRTKIPDSRSSPEEWAEAGERHQRFHDAIVAACSSPWLLYFRSLLLAQGNRYQAQAARRDKKLTAYRSNDEHRAIMEAALDRNEAKVAELIEDHVRRTAAAVLAQLREEESKDVDGLVAPRSRRKRANGLNQSPGPRSTGRRA